MRKITRRTYLRATSPAFTRAELLGVLVVVALLLTIVLPALAANRSRSDRVACANNLRQIGVALQVWANDHDDLSPFDVRASDGGTLAHPLAPNAWLHFSWISNELATPKVLFCPSDVGQPARDFSGDPVGGYLHPNFANRATSYFITHFRSWVTSALQVGDRNISTSENGQCFRFGPAPLVRTRPTLPSTRWTNGLHGQAGNLLFFDGSVEESDNWRLRIVLDSGEPDAGGGAPVHLAIPR